MNKSFSKIRHIQESNIILERRLFVSESSSGTQVVIPPDKIKELKNTLYSKIMTLPKPVKYDLGVQDNESVDSIFSKLGETSINFDGSYVSVDLGDIGKKHNVGLSFGFSTGGNKSLPDPSSVLQPDTSVDVSLTIPINNPIKLKKVGGVRL